jgi:hypothetical protein
MAREIQSQSNRPQGGKAVIAQLANAVFWVIVAIAVPVEEFLRPFPEAAPYAHFAPVLFYVLAAWSFLRAIRALQLLAASRMWTPRIRTAGATPPTQTAGGRRAKGDATVAVTRPPTVQRMR